MNPSLFRTLANAALAPAVRLAANFVPDELRRRRLRDFRLRTDFPMIDNPKVFLTLCVKNEADILEWNLRFHRAMGVDGVIAADNGSTDGTGEILKRYQAAGLVKEILFDDAPNHPQQRLVDSMIRIARDRFKADWVINADADEFFFCRLGNYKKALAKERRNILYCWNHPMFSPNEDVACAVEESVFRVMRTVRNHPGLGRYPVCKIGRKAVHRTDGYRMVREGNGGVQMDDPSEGFSKDIVIYHYNWRDLRHFIRKSVDGARAYALSSAPASAGSHWRHYARIFEERGAEAMRDEYARLLGIAVLDEFQRKGVVSVDTTIADFFRSLRDGDEKTEKTKPCVKSEADIPEWDPMKKTDGASKR